jgi:hypothetical protein
MTAAKCGRFLACSQYTPELRCLRAFISPITLNATSGGLEVLLRDAVGSRRASWAF